jgi:hypothetical protein
MTLREPAASKLDHAGSHAVAARRCTERPRDYVIGSHDTMSHDIPRFETAIYRQQRASISFLASVPRPIGAVCGPLRTPTSRQTPTDAQHRPLGPIGATGLRRTLQRNSVNGRSVHHFNHPRTPDLPPILTSTVMSDDRVATRLSAGASSSSASTGSLGKNATYCDDPQSSTFMSVPCRG